MDIPLGCIETGIDVTLKINRRPRKRFYDEPLPKLCPWCNSSIETEVLLDPGLWGHQFHKCTGCEWEYDRIITDSPLLSFPDGEPNFLNWECSGCGKKNRIEQKTCGASEWDGCGGARKEYESQNC